VQSSVHAFSNWLEKGLLVLLIFRKKTKKFCYYSKLINMVWNVDFGIILAL